MDQNVDMPSPVRVMITFLDGPPEGSNKALSLEDFSFAKSRERLKHIKTSLSEEVINERRQD